MTVNDLYAKGWTIRQAARRIGVSYSHIAYVLRGKRSSLALLAKLRALPQRDLNLRERIAK